LHSEIKKAPEIKEFPGAFWSLYIRSFWKIHFINPPGEQGQAVRSKGMVGCDDRKIAQNRKGVKRDFRLPLGSIFGHWIVRNYNILWGASAFKRLLLRAIMWNSAKFKE
jgi:hypothetical protein